MRIVFSCLLLLYTHTLVAAELASFSAEYSIHAKGIKIATTTRTFRHLEKQHYQFEVTTISPIPILKSHILEKSQGLWQQGPKPQFYVFDQKSRISNKALHQVFNWQNNTIKSDYKDKHREFNIIQGMQDKLSFQLQLQLDLLNGKKQFRYSVANRKKLEPYVFNITGHESISTPMGTFNTLKIKRIKYDPKRDTVFWVAPALDYTLVKIQHREKKYTVTALLTHYKLLK